jgi:hypothetical protein
MRDTRTQSEIAADLVGELFADTQRVAIADAIAAGKERGVSYITLYREARLAGIRTVRNGRHGGFWERQQ